MIEESVIVQVDTAPPSNGTFEDGGLVSETQTTSLVTPYKTNDTNGTKDVPAKSTLPPAFRPRGRGSQFSVTTQGTSQRNAGNGGPRRNNGSQDGSGSGNQGSASNGNQGDSGTGNQGNPSNESQEGADQKNNENGSE